MLKIGMIPWNGIPPWKIGGAEYYVHYLTKGFAERGHEVHIFTHISSKEGGRKFGDNIFVHNISLGRHFGYMSRPLEALKYFSSIVKQTSFLDIVHGNNPYSEGLATVMSSKVLSVPGVITWHGGETTRILPDTSDRSLKKSLWKIQVKSIAEHCDRVIFVSNFIKDLVIQHLGFNSVKAVVIQHGVDHSLFKPRKPKFREVMGWSEDVPIICTVCRLDPLKNLTRLILAMKRIVTRFPRAKLLVVGDGVERKNLEGLTNQLDLTSNISFLGFIQHKLLPEVLSACDVFVLPSKSESFGIAFVEAWACARPVIGLDIAPINMLIETGVNGLLVNDDESSMARAIIKLLENENLRHELGMRGWKATQSLTWDRTVNETLTLYDSLLNG
nr:glycosyltransferase family 4 protein [Candidatus Njordarchaeota archaeon]